MTQPEGKPMFPIPAVNQWKDESTDGPVKKLQALLEQHWPGLNLLAATYRSMTSKACRCCSQRAVSPMPQSSLLVGLGLGGLVDARCIN
jgi:hypothetical protein